MGRWEGPPANIWEKLAKGQFFLGSRPVTALTLVQVTVRVLLATCRYPCMLAACQARWTRCTGKFFSSSRLEIFLFHGYRLLWHRQSGAGFMII